MASLPPAFMLKRRFREACGSRWKRRRPIICATSCDFTMAARSRLQWARRRMAGLVLGPAAATDARRRRHDAAPGKRRHPLSVCAAETCPARLYGAKNGRNGRGAVAARPDPPCRRIGSTSTVMAPMPRGCRRCGILSIPEFLRPLARRGCWPLGHPTGCWSSATRRRVGRSHRGASAHSGRPAAPVCRPDRARRAASITTNGRRCLRILHPSPVTRARILRADTAAVAALALVQAVSAIGEGFKN